MATDIRFKDFTVDAQPIRFQVNDDVFTAPAVLPIPVMQQLTTAVEKLKGVSDAAAFDAILEVFDAILVDDSARRFRERVADKVQPIGIEQVVNIMNWLIEVYGLRPTEQSSDSSAGQPAETSGMLSTAGVPSAG